MSHVIYAAYGSNLLKERFLAYIKGGTFMGIHYEGCRDKTEPDLSDGCGFHIGFTSQRVLEGGIIRE